MFVRVYNAVSILKQDLEGATTFALLPEKREEHTAQKPLLYEYVATLTDAIAVCAWHDVQRFVRSIFRTVSSFSQNQTEEYEVFSNHVTWPTTVDIRLLLFPNLSQSHDFKARIHNFTGQVQIY